MQLYMQEQKMDMYWTPFCEREAEMLTKWQRKGLAAQGHYPPWRAIAWLIYHEYIYTNAPINTCKIGGPLTNSPYLHRVMVWLFFLASSRWPFTSNLQANSLLM